LGLRCQIPYFKKQGILRAITAKVPLGAGYVQERSETDANAHFCEAKVLQVTGTGEQISAAVSKAKMSAARQSAFGEFFARDAYSLDLRILDANGDSHCAGNAVPS
jgi:hypothetical protein